MRTSALARAVWLCGLLAAGLAGCAGAELAERTERIRDRLAKARDKGAYRCAPRELATGEANVEFAERELHKGEYFAARRHLSVAAAAADRALLLAADEQRCSGPSVPPPRRPEPAPDPIADEDEDTIPDVEDRCPDEPEDRDGFRDEDGCPDPDNDEDGFPDAADRCPVEPEDVDGFKDDDGCPDSDNDGDTVSDAEDKCPAEAGLPADGGCPRPFELIQVNQDKIELKQAIFFETAKATLRSASFPLLDEVAAVLLGRPSMQIRIEGHTDNRGGRGRNLRLSQARSESVKAYLIGKGISSDRMQAKGYGPDLPIDKNETRAGRERNRRVEFMITQQ